MRPPEIDLTRSVVAVTGAGRGIGRATAAAFAARGATVALGDLDVDTAQEAAIACGGQATHNADDDQRNDQHPFKGEDAVLFLPRLVEKSLHEKILSGVVC